MAMNISKAIFEDIPQLEILINNAYRGEQSKKGWTTEAYLLDGKRTDADALKKIMSQPGVAILKYCNDDNRLTGCVYLKKNFYKMYLGMLTVSPDLQARGIGKQLLKASEQYAKENKCDAIEMTVISIRHELIAWYERHGYFKTAEIRPFTVDPKFVKSKQPLEFIVLEKSL